MARPTVTVHQGKLEGVTEKTPIGFSYNSFLGIPYAKPPVGSLRFKEPIPADAWEGARDASVEGNVCSHIDIFFKKAYCGEEDCLYLNVYVPEGTPADAELPVMFWIHGGGFTSGSGSKEIYGPDHLIDKNVIIVAINYRLGPLGFLCLRNAELPGNLGLKDQVLALKWVNDNIKFFGGNSKNITIFGESAGAASVHFIMMSPTTKGLFAKAIIQSGVSFSEWSIQSDPVGVAFKLGELLGCKTESKEELLNFLKNVPVQTLATVSASPSLNVGNEIAFAPVIEESYPQTQAFITEHPREILKAGRINKVPTLSGSTSNEGVLFAMKFEGLNPETLTLEQIVPNFEIYVPKSVNSNQDKAALAKKIKDFYFSDETNLVDNFFTFMTDYAFVKDIDFSVKQLSRLDSTYYYRFSYNGSLNIMKLLWKMPYKGAAHADELGYLFKLSVPGIAVEMTEMDISVVKVMTELWTNFAKHANPTPDITGNINVIWKPVTKNEINCLDINEECTLLQNPFQERMKFWADLNNKK